MSNVPSIFAAPPGQGGNSNNNTSNNNTTSTYTPYSAAPAPPTNTYQYQPQPQGGSNYTPYNPSSTTTPSSTSTYTPYTPSAAASSGYTPTSTYSSAPAPTPPFSQALNVPPPTQQYSAPASQYSSAPAPSAYNNARQSSNDTYKPSADAYKPSAAAYGGAGPTSMTPYANATATATPSTTYQHGSGPTHGVMTQAGNPVICHNISYEIKGSEMQLVEIHLDPQETVIAEAGAMMYLENDIDFKTKFGDGSEPKQGFFKKLMAAGGRIMTGESLFITHFTNLGSVTRKAAFAAPYPGSILPIDLMELQQRYPHPSGDPDRQTSLICQKDAFLCAAKGTKLSIHFHKKIGAGLFGGEGFILQKLKGDGMAFCHAGGTVIRREMKPGDRLRVDTGCLVAFTTGINYSIEMSPGLKTMFFGGEGLFLATLEGEGIVWLQSLPFSRLADRVLMATKSRQGEGSALTGGFGNMIDGDGPGFGFPGLRI